MVAEGSQANSDWVIRTPPSWMTYCYLPGWGHVWWEMELHVRSSWTFQLHRKFKASLDYMILHITTTATGQNKRKHGLLETSCTWMYPARFYFSQKHFFSISPICFLHLCLFTMMWCILGTHTRIPMLSGLSRHQDHQPSKSLSFMHQHKTDWGP